MSGPATAGLPLGVLGAHNYRISKLERSPVLALSRELVSALSQSEMREMTTLINLASQPHRRIFPGDRLAPGSIEEGYRDCLAICLRDSNDALAACVLTKKSGEATWLFLLTVRDDLQGLGVGSTLVDHAAAVAAEEESALLRLEAVDAGNLVPYYQRLGFVIEQLVLCPVGKWGATEEFRLATLARPADNVGPAGSQ